MNRRVDKKQFMFFRRLPPLPQGEYGGLEKLMFDWFERIDYAAIEVVVVVTTGWKDRFLKEAQQRHLDLMVVEAPFDFFHRSPRQRFFDMSDILKGYNPYAIVFFQAHYEEFGLPELIPAALKSRGNVFMHENTGSLQPPQVLSKKHFGFIPGIGLWWHYYMFCIKARAYVTKKILAVSHEIKNRYVSWWGYPSEKVLVSYHGVDSKSFFPDSNIRTRLRGQLAIPEGDKVFVMVARFTPLKRIDRAIRAFDMVCRDQAHIHLALVGSGPLEDECRHLTAGLPCARQVHFIGQVDNPADYLKMADIFVLSSDNEGLSIALMEAMACGLIAVSTDCSGSSEVIAEGKTGFMVSKNDESLAQGMRQALALSASERRQMAEAAMHLIHGQFDINNNVNLAFKTMGMSH